MLNSGFKTISDFENIQKVLSENDITWKTTQKDTGETFGGFKMDDKSVFKSTIF